MRSEPLVEHRLTLRDLGEATAFVGAPDGPHDASGAVLALCHGTWKDRRAEGGLLVRIQSSCVYGEVFGSRQCDCLEQLTESILRIRKEGAGIIVYLNQEGRGAGLITKAKGYRLSQDRNIDSFEAYRSMGLPPDQRDYAPAAWILTELGVTDVRVMTNNPGKVKALVDGSIRAERCELWVRSPGDPDTVGLYLASKLEEGHLPPERDPDLAVSALPAPVVG